VVQVDAKQSLLDVFWSLNNGGTPLGTFQRVLLMTDGTVTDVLEAYTAEAIRVIKLDQEFGRTGSESPQLDLDDGERVLHRSVLLQGAMSGTNYLHGHSVITTDRLPPEVLEGLLTSGQPIGRLLAKNRVETFREIVGVGFEPAAECAEWFGVAPTSNLVFRTYRIHVRRRPVMRITEKFPVTWFAASVDI